MNQVVYIRNNVILPPDSGNLDIDSGDALFESAGELEIENNESEYCSDDETVQSKKSRNDNPHWRKARIFSKEIPTSLSETFPDLITKRPFNLWSSFITNEF